MRKFLPSMLPVVLLVACGGDKNAEEEEGVFDPMVETIDKAREVEDAALKHKQEMDKRLQQMEGEQDNGAQ